MSKESLAYRQAKKRTCDFRDESSQVIREHVEAMACRDCEDFLRLGISAYHWLNRAEDILRESIYAGERQDDPGLSDALDTLYSTWLSPAEVAKDWIEKLSDMDYMPDNRDEFYDTCDKVAAIVEQRAWSSVAADSRKLTDGGDW